MKEISITHILNNMNDDNNYADDIWKTCLDKKGKRYKRKNISNSLRKLEQLGFVKKIKISSTDNYYNKLHIFFRLFAYIFFTMRWTLLNQS